jgi:hypothetical protein
MSFQVAGLPTGNADTRCARVQSIREVESVRSGSPALTPGTSPRRSPPPAQARAQHTSSTSQLASKASATPLGSTDAADQTAPSPALHAAEAQAPEAGDAAQAPDDGTEPIVFLHGVGVGVLPYLPFIARLAATFRRRPVLVLEARPTLLLVLSPPATWVCHVSSCAPLYHSA